MQIKIHPLFFVLALVLVLLGQALAFFWTFAAVCLHEIGHAVAARARGYVVKQLVLLPFGAVMSSEDEFDRASGVIVGLTGPAVNITLALILLGVWWLFPAVYPYTEFFLYANLSIGLFNLLPVYPLDGSRIVLGIAKNKLKAVKGLRIAGITVSFVFFALFIASAFFDINFTLGITAVFLFFGATSGTGDEMYVSILSSTAKKYDIGVESKKITVDGNTPIARLYHHISGTTETVFEVIEVSENAAPTRLFTLNESELKSIAVANRLSSPIAAARENLLSGVRCNGGAMRMRASSKSVKRANR